MTELLACRSCAELVPAGICVCPHCGAGGVCRTAALPAAAILMGLTLSGCFFVGQPDYGAAETAGEWDWDGDGWALEEGDCDDDDDTIHPGAEETPGDGIDSNCDGEDDT